VLRDVNVPAGAAPHPLHLDQNILDADREGTLILEYLRRGNLDTFLSQVVTANTRIPERLLWHIFGCCKLPQLFWTSQTSGWLLIIDLQ
jgi:hypothetical protein